MEKGLEDWRTAHLIPVSKRRQRRTWETPPNLIFVLRKVFKQSIDTMFVSTRISMLEPIGASMDTLQINCARISLSILTVCQA